MKSSGPPGHALLLGTVAAPAAKPFSDDVHLTPFFSLARLSPLLKTRFRRISLAHVDRIYKLLTFSPASLAASDSPAPSLNYAGWAAKVSKIAVACGTGHILFFLRWFFLRWPP